MHVMIRVAPGLACAVMLTFAGTALVACSSASEASGAPPVAASPEQVARVYLHAAFSGDCTLTAALTLPHTWSWCSNPKLLDYRSVKRPGYVPASEAGRNEECVGFWMDTRGSQDGSLPAGWQPWSLCLVKTHVGWRVYDQGQG